MARPYSRPTSVARRRHGHAIATLKYGAATKTAIQFGRAIWRKRGKPRAFGTALPIGAVWDGNEEQGGHARLRNASARQAGLPRRSHGVAKAGILTLLAGGGASASTRAMLSQGGPARILREITWLDLKKTEMIASTSVSWEEDRWARGGYAFFDTAFTPSIRTWLARPFARF